MMASNNAKRVFFNTIALYIRTIILTLISLFSVRIILNALGESDYGLYNVVAGFVTMFSFISGTMISSSQRFFSVALATNDWNKVNKLFSVSIIIYLAYIGIILVLAESIGLWFVWTQLSYPAEQTIQVIIVYEISIFSTLVTLIASPFIALLVSNENFSIYSVIAVLEGVLKVVIAYLMYTVGGQKLIIYAALMCFSTILVNACYIIYTWVKFKQLRFSLCKEKEEYKSLFSFLNWNMIGSVASVGKSQGVNVIINIFFGPVVNAARSIAFQVQSVMLSFSQNFMKAMEPQITKFYASGEHEKFMLSIYSASKLSFFLLFVMAVPLIVNIDYVMKLWLENVPEYTIQFTVLVLIDAVILSITDPLYTACQAVGRIKWYQIIVGSIYLLNLPLSWLLVYFLRDPMIPFLIGIILSVAMMLGRIFVFKRLYHFSVCKYLLKVILPIIMVAAIVICFDYFLLSGAQNFGYLVLNVVGSVVISLLAMFFIGTTKLERQKLLSFVKRKRGKRDNGDSLQ